MAKYEWLKEKMATREAYGVALRELAKENEKVCVVEADLSGSTKTKEFQKVAPERFFNVGVAEQDLMGTASGLAQAGMTVYASTFAMFAAGRAWEIIRQSISYPHMNVKVCPTHAGITVGEDGASHQIIEDIGLMRVIPKMKVLVPADAIQTYQMVKFMADDFGPTYLRLGRAGVKSVFPEDYKFEMGKGHILNQGEGVCLFVTGYVTRAALDSVEILKEKGVNLTVVNLPTIKPIDKDLIVKMAQTHEHLFSVEEHSVLCGLGSAISEVLTDSCPKKLTRLGLQDEFGQSGPASELLSHYKLDAKGIADSIQSVVS